MCKTLNQLENVVADYRSLKALAEELNEQLKALERDMLDYLDSNEKLSETGSDFTVKVSTCERRTLDSKRLEADLGSLAESVKKLVIWVLGIVMTLFTGLLSIQSFAGAAADNLSARAVKFAASSFIPVIGGSVSEAYSAVKGSIGVIRTSVGVIGVIIMSVIVAKPLLTLLAVKLAVWIGATINDIFGISNSGGLLKSINSVLSIGVSILAAYSIMFVISTSVVIMTAMNTGA